jgi:hypothetical protein
LFAMSIPECTSCGGDGRHDVGDPSGSKIVLEECHRCHGSGEEPRPDCDICGEPATVRGWVRDGVDESSARRPEVAKHWHLCPSCIVHPDTKLLPVPLEVLP